MIQSGPQVLPQLHVIIVTWDSNRIQWVRALANTGCRTVRASGLITLMIIITIAILVIIVARAAV